MANKVVTLSREPKKNTELEVYSDVDMVSTPISPTRYNYNSLEHEALLRSEGNSETEISAIIEEGTSDTQLNFYFNDPTHDLSREEDEKKKVDFRITKDVNIKAIYNSLRNIFTWVPGERVLDPEFGSKLRLYLYEGITEYNKEKIVSEIEHCCIKWEPRVKIVKLVDVSTNEDTEDNIVRLDIIFTVPTLSEEQYTYSYIYTRHN